MGTLVMGRYCRMCNSSRSNESFSGAGHKNCICKSCQKLPKETIARINAMEDLLNFWDQSNISQNNIRRIDELKNFDDKEIQDLANLTFDVATAKPRKKRRLGWLKKNRQSLYARVIEFFGEDFDENYYPQEDE